MRFYILNNEYMDYITKFDNKVPKVDYVNSKKPALGVVFNNGEYEYFVPISSPKPKHIRMNDALDFIKINGDTRLYGVMNLNNMIPVPRNEVKELDWNSLDELRTFEKEIDKMKYMSLLTLELEIAISKKERIEKNAKRLYSMYDVPGNEHLKNRCCDFKLLEAKCSEYIELKEITKKQRLQHGQTKNRKHESEI